MFLFVGIERSDNPRRHHGPPGGGRRQPSPRGPSLPTLRPVALRSWLPGPPRQRRCDERGAGGRLDRSFLPPPTDTRPPAVRSRAAAASLGRWPRRRPHCCGGGRRWRWWW